MTETIPKLGATLGYCLLLPVVFACFFWCKIRKTDDYPAWIDTARDRLEEAGVF